MNLKFTRRNNYGSLAHLTGTQNSNIFNYSTKQNYPFASVVDDWISFQQASLEKLPNSTWLSI
nr:hypothetical protein Iba_chr04bCG10880 [Ipomoea batatas]GMC86316.1 hypothetical protein Iba_chr04dCG9760 [Ipomoea batatas]